MVAITGDTLDTTTAYTTTPGDIFFKRQIVITGVCFLPCSPGIRQIPHTPRTAHPVIMFLNVITGVCVLPCYHVPGIRYRLRCALVDKRHYMPVVSEDFFMVDNGRSHQHSSR